MVLTYITHFNNNINLKKYYTNSERTHRIIYYITDVRHLLDEN